MMYPGQTTALEQYPNSGMNIPQVDAIRRARAGSRKPLYTAAEEVMGGPQAMSEQIQGAMGGTKPQAEMGGMKPMAEGGGFGGTKPSFDRMSQFGRRPPDANAKAARVGAPTGRGLPGVPGPAPRIRGNF